MDMHFHERATLDLHNEELDTFRVIVRLAAERLAAAPATKMKGVPLERQAGLVGVDLFRARTMLEKFGQRLGIDITEKTWEPKPQAAGSDIGEMLRSVFGADFATSPDVTLVGIYEIKP